MRESLYCIRCGACLNVCPVYQKIGGQAYGWIYTVPIGAIISPQLQGLQKARELPFASSLCGACRVACPVNINIPDLLLNLRAKVMEQQGGKFSERTAMHGFSLLGSRPRIFSAMGAIGRRVARMMGKNGKLRRINFPGLGSWLRYRDFAAPNESSFRAWWKEQDHNG
jgi:L-lactate dehydrogenase complex protein LldF